VKTASILSLTLGLVLAACGEEQAAVVVDTLPVQGALIDGSDDVLAEPIEVEQPVEVSGLPATAPPDVLAESVEEAVVAEVLEPEPEVEEPDGPLDITYQDLSLIDFDVDAILDYMLFPDEYEGEDKQYLELPADILRLDGRELSITGYMIPGEMDRGNVRDFMLVRDLMGCCFGGAPMPDEWLDVVMEEDVEAAYRPYMPMRVTGIMTLGGEQDEAGFAMGIYRLKATSVEVED
jgi:hypothetical protein